MMGAFSGAEMQINGLYIFWRVYVSNETKTPTENSLAIFILASSILNQPRITSVNIDVNY